MSLQNMGAKLLVVIMVLLMTGLHLHASEEDQINMEELEDWFTRVQAAVDHLIDNRQVCPAQPAWPSLQDFYDLKFNVTILSTMRETMDATMHELTETQCNLQEEVN